MAETNATDSGSAPVENRPHKPADDREEIYYEGTPMLRGELGLLILWSVIGILLIASPFIYRSMKMEWPIWWVTLALILLGIVAILIPVVKLRTVRYRISNYRIDFERGIFTRRIDTMELWHVEDISFQQSLSDRIMGVGTIKVISHDDTNPVLLLQGLPNPRPLFESLKQRIIAVKRQRGVIKMDVS